MNHQPATMNADAPIRTPLDSNRRRLPRVKLNQSKPIAQGACQPARCTAPLSTIGPTTAAAGCVREDVVAVDSGDSVKHNQAASTVSSGVREDRVVDERGVATGQP